MSFDAFLTFPDTIKGETTDAEFGPKNGIDILSFSFGLSNPSSVGTGSGLGAGKVSFSSINIMKRMDSASTDLMLCSSSGKHLTSAVLHIRKAGGDAKVTYLTFTLKKVMIDSVQVSGSQGGDDYPTESVSIAFAELDVAYTPQAADGTAGTTKNFGWNLETNKKV